MPPPSQHESSVLKVEHTPFEGLANGAVLQTLGECSLAEAETEAGDGDAATAEAASPRGGNSATSSSIASGGGSLFHRELLGLLVPLGSSQLFDALLVPRHRGWGRLDFAQNGSLAFVLARSFCLGSG